jgi:hypothetical protein
LEVDTGPGPEPFTPRSQYELGIIDLVGKTLDLWARKLPQYIVIIGLTGAAIVIFQAILLVGLYGLAGVSLLEFIGTSPIDAVFSLVIYEFPADILLIIFSLSIVSMIVYAIVAGAAITYAVDDYESPGSGDISSSFSDAIGKAIPLIGVQILQSLIVIGLAFVAIITLFVNIFVFIAMLFLVLYIAVRLAPSAAVVIIEDQSSVSALGRSWQITNNQFWHVFLGQILMGIASIILGVILSILVGVVFGVPFGVLIGILISSIFTSLLISPLNYIFQAVLYKDLEARGTSAGYDWWQ